MQSNTKNAIMKQLNINPQKTNFTKLDVSSPWKGLENYLPSIIRELNIKPNKALEFGVDHGYSTHIFSQLFGEVTGVDSFVGDDHIIHEQGEDFLNAVKSRFHGTNVNSVKSPLEDFTQSDYD